MKSIPSSEGARRHHLARAMAASASFRVDPQLVLLVGSTLEEVHRGRPLGRGTALWLGARAVTAAAAAQEGWSMRAYGLQPALLCSSTASSEGWRLCTAPLLSESLQRFLAESLLLWDWAGCREQKVGTWQFISLDLPVLVLSSQALHVALAAAMVRTGSRDISRTFRSWYTAWSVGSTGAAMAFYALECSTAVPAEDAATPAVCFGLLQLPPSLRPYACWEPLAIAGLLSPAAASVQACAHVSGIWAGLLWGKIGGGGGGRGAAVLRNGVLQRGGGRGWGGWGQEPDRTAAAGAGGHRLGGARDWCAMSPLLVHAGITAAVLVLTYAQRKRQQNNQRGSTLLPGAFGGAGNGGAAGSWELTMVDAREQLADAAASARDALAAWF